MATPKQPAAPEAQNVPSQVNSRPTPSQHECDQFTLAQMSNSLPQHGVVHSADGSAVDPQSFDVTVKPATWPEP